MPPRRRKRLDPAAFKLPVEEIRAGMYSEKYLLRVRDLLSAERTPPRLVMQVTCTQPAMLGGIDEAIAILKLCSDDWSALTVHALAEGDRVEAWETVMTIEGPYHLFAHLETLYLGVLSRRTGIATRTRETVDAARPKQVLVLSARYDHWQVQPGDGYAMIVGGAKGGTTEAQGKWENTAANGTVPHTLVAAYGGDTVRAAKCFADQAGPDVPILALVDYDNDCVATSLQVARALDTRLWGVRLDTPEHLVDKSILPRMGSFPPTGVNPQLVWNVRNALDAEGYGDVKIVVSGGFTVQRIRAFEEEGVPVDAYGIGASLLDGRFDFTADIVQREGKPELRVGREARPNARMERVK